MSTPEASQNGSSEPNRRIVMAVVSLSYILRVGSSDSRGSSSAFSYDMSYIGMKKSLRYIAEACGGTLAFEEPYSEYDDLSKSDGRHIPLVSVSKCIFCVGVYFRISTTQAFDAHIQAYREPRITASCAYVSPEEGDKVKATIIRKLEVEATEHSWNPATVDKSSVILVCPQPDRFTNRADEANAKPEDKELKLAGWYVAGGIKHFLQLPAGQHVETGYQGFVVHHGAGHEAMLAVLKSEKDGSGFVRFIEAPEVNGYRKVEVYQTRGWDINAAKLA
ncbi:hypothetical protein LTR78_006175 [Recurvomyces mirabilis]|uniref:Uncharacterized protein n=1 Tax=Recurvomyces mirabilis TaxID=574656 RepID=A0AAE1C0N2_9PEZI|nr:hypothetical protein LTR78_006175 [Recurvomyces mirabilis]KAK5152017.1 hypothetical protein LTS14_008791 [Recurvomyces mirabilis]